MKRDAGDDPAAIDRTATAESWTLDEVRGRGALGSAKGLPPVSQLSFTRGLAEKFTASVKDPTGIRCPGRVRAIVDAGTFSHCPICLEVSPNTDEHVPQQGLGGKKMTATCAACNNKLGSRLESKLLAWYDRRLSNVRVSAASFRGARRVPDVFVRQLGNGQDLYIPDVGRIDEEVASLLSSLAPKERLSFTLHYSVPAINVVKLAALKHAYLAGCLATHTIPDDDRARAIRQMLVTVRDKGDREPFPQVDELGDFEVRITGMEPIDFSILIVEWLTPEGTLTEVLLGGTVSTSWPLSEGQFARVDEVSRKRDEAIEAARQEARRSAPGIY